MENNNNVEVNQKTPAQEVLITKILKSSKLKDSEYRMLRGILDTKVVTTFDAGVFIEYVLGMLKFRRHFFNGKHKAYKKCYYCTDRNEVERYLNMSNGKKAWVCSTCAVNLDPAKFVPVKIAEEQEVKADLHRKYDYPPEQEEIDDGLRHGDLE